MLDRLMTSTTMSGRPSIYLNELMALSTRLGIGDDIIRHKFLQALPKSIAPVLASQTDLEISRLGKMADDLITLFNRNENTHINQVSLPSSSKQASSTTNSSKNKGVSNIPYGLRPFNDNQKPKVCKAHIYFAESAKY